ncbi:fibroblast growth factor 11-like [Arapaima gigas]
MAALASSLIRQKRAVKDEQANRPVSSKRRPCPKSNKSLCQKQILVLISKVRLCSGNRGRSQKRPGKQVPFTPTGCETASLGPRTLLRVHNLLPPWLHVGAESMSESLLAAS